MLFSHSLLKYCTRIVCNDTQALEERQQIMARTMTYSIINTPIAITAHTELPDGNGVRGHTAPKIPELKR